MLPTVLPGFTDARSWRESVDSGTQEERRNDMDVRVKRVREAAAANDGTRILVDRVWPRGVAKDEVEIDEWLKDVAPSTELRKWYAHDAEKFDEFAKRYRAELDTEKGEQALQELRGAIRGKRVTLLTDSKAVDRSQAVVLAELLKS